MNRRVFLASLMTSAAVVAVSGCGPKAPYELVPISGVATYQGKPIPTGFRVEFIPADGSRSSFGNIQEGGKFEAVHTPSQKGVKSGTCQVKIYWNDNPEINPVPEEYAEMIAKYGHTGTDVKEIEIKKKDKNFKIDFE
ncbi:MAG: hypothetical protein J6K20_06785 [Thermoguttaceae bacterium]|nr:hypothetical protein [Thermoguttaceae bacterium]